jgi:hypothetical protein
MNRREFFGAAGALAAGPALAGAAGVQSAATAATAGLAKQVKITGLETDVLHFPGGRVYYDAIHEFGGAHGGLVLRLKTDAGIVGWASSSFGTEPGAELALQQFWWGRTRRFRSGCGPICGRRWSIPAWRG